MVNLLIVAPHKRFHHHVPAGFIFADEVFTEAKIKDSISARQNPVDQLERALIYLANRFPHRVRFRWIDPWSPIGLWTAFRFRLRNFPSVILNGKEVLTGSHLHFQTFIDTITEKLSETEDH